VSGALVLKVIASTERNRHSLDEPAPCVMADGIGGVCRRGWQYWIEGATTLMAPNHVPSDGDPVAPVAPPHVDKVVDSRPPYLVPSMDEIRALPWNGFKAASTFSGCGGSSLGYRMAGFRVLYANEFIEAARDTYRANAAPYTYLDDRDIREVTPESLMELAGVVRGELDLLDGSPPCASFSTAGKRQKAWGEEKTYSDTKQRADDLFFEFSRLVKGVQPKTFVAENVSGLVKGVAKGYFLEILAELKASGYRVEARLLDAQWLGVPQARQRLIFVGVREDLELDPAHPKPLGYRYSIRDALPWITQVVHDTSGLYGAGEVTDKPVPTIMAKPHGAQFELNAPPVEAESDISRFAIGEEWDKLKPGEQSERYFSLVRTDADAPSPTVTAAGGTASLAGVTHPTEKRKFSIFELRRLCGFPDDFELTGTYGQQWERLGRAVPPVMMSHVAATVRDEILAKVKP
jgi:DNA (cytosine-5)-methyltransferase 1